MNEEWNLRKKRYGDFPAVYILVNSGGGYGREICGHIK